MKLPESLPENKAFREKSQRFWSKRYGRELSMGEVDEIIRNLTGYFNVLLSWQQQDNAKKSNSGSTPDTGK